MARKKRHPRRITFHILRYMRRPIITLVVVYAVSMVGWILIPGVDLEGEPERLSFFHSFYFLTYTVTTTGFGELPHAFTEAQRMWGMVSLYSGVIAWFYALGSIVSLIQNPDFQAALEERRFTRSVARIDSPFYIVCGFGNTGALLTRGLSDAGMTVIVVDWRVERIRNLQLRDYRSEVVGLCADAREPEHLIEAGLLKPNCRAVVALTQDEDLNLKIAVTARLLCDQIEVVIQSTSRSHEETLASLGANIHIVDPFQTYARYLGATVHTPAVHTVNQWLSGTPNATLDQVVRPPDGVWLICGFGRMGRWLTQLLRQQGIQTIVIEPDPAPDLDDDSDLIVGRATKENLRLAGINKAAGIVAATQSDTDNLSIVLHAKSLNPDIFIVVRQNRYRNQLLFKAADVDQVMMPSLVCARRVLYQLIAPMLKSFFELLHDDHHTARQIEEVVETLRNRVGGTQPKVWTIETNDLGTPAVKSVLSKALGLTLRDLLRDPADRTKQLDGLPLVLENKTGQHVLPELDSAINIGDRILMCGSEQTQRLVDAALNNPYSLAYNVTGIDEPRGWIMQWLQSRTKRLNAKLDLQHMSK